MIRKTLTGNDMTMIDDYWSTLSLVSKKKISQFYSTLPYVCQLIVMIDLIKPHISQTRMICTSSITGKFNHSLVRFHQGAYAEELF